MTKTLQVVTIHLKHLEPSEAQDINSKHKSKTEKRLQMPYAIKRHEMSFCTFYGLYHMT